MIWLIPKCVSRYLKSFSCIQRLKIRSMISPAGRFLSSVNTPTSIISFFGFTARTISLRTRASFAQLPSRQLNRQVRVSVELLRLRRVRKLPCAPAVSVQSPV